MSPIEVARSKLRQHWDGVFSQEASAEPDEWFVPFEALERLFAGRGRLRVLVAGCGRSLLGVELSRRGHWVVNLDLSGVVIDQMRARHPECGEWVVGDVTNLTGLVREGAFDVVVDKGTSDTLSFRVSTKLKEMRTVMLRSFLAESFRVLQPGGRLLIITTRSRIKVGLTRWNGLTFDARSGAASRRALQQSGSGKRRGCPSGARLVARAARAAAGGGDCAQRRGSGRSDAAATQLQRHSTARQLSLPEARVRRAGGSRAAD